ncbi:regulatory protein RecX [Modestobacter italicus]|uniref:regulatory protein RecX n=1 Tax=Modestobacter italicus (strain DSM 44449 / CECT 9708 / BC 501) TaxID=2732864 RepID=UPI0027E0D81E|nr:regulatory protein RecX [Modestobacter italicus]
MSDTLFGESQGGGFGDDAGRTGGAGRRSGRRRTGRPDAAARSGGPDDGSTGGSRGRGKRSSGPQWSRSSTAGDDADGPAEMEDPEAVARGICLRALTGAAKTRKQLADLLAKKEVPADAAAAVLDRFTEVGLIDDAAFAAAWVTSRQSGRGLARRALTAELRAKGVDDEVAAAAVAEVDPQDEWDSARALVARKMTAMRRLDRVTAERRLIGMLARKGYGGGLAGYVVREALDALAEELRAEDAADDAPAAAADDASSVGHSTDEAPAARRSSFGNSSFGSSRNGGRGSSWRRGATAASAAEEEVDEPLADDDPDAPSPVPWSRERSAARAAARAGAAAPAGGLDPAAEVGEGLARPVGRLRPPPGALPADDLP